MATSVTFVKNSFGPGTPARFRVAGLAAGKNSINLQTALTDISLIQQLQGGANGFIPTGVNLRGIYDGTHTVPSKLMYDPATLSATNIDIYCDATGSTSCELELI